MAQHPPLGLVRSAGAHSGLQSSSSALQSFVPCCVGLSHSESQHGLGVGVWDSWPMTSEYDASFLYLWGLSLLDSILSSFSTTTIGDPYPMLMSCLLTCDQSHEQPSAAKRHLSRSELCGLLAL